MGKVTRASLSFGLDMLALVHFLGSVCWLGNLFGVAVQFFPFNADIGALYRSFGFAFCRIVMGRGAISPKV